MYPTLYLVFRTQKNLHLELHWQVENQPFLHFQRYVQSVVFDVDEVLLLSEKVPLEIRRIEVLPAYLAQYRMYHWNRLDLAEAVSITESREQDGACELSER